MLPVIEFLNPQTLEFVSGVAEYTSLSWENKTDGCGSIELHIPYAFVDASHGMIIHICRDIPEPYGIVTRVKISDDDTVIYASTLSRVFDWRYMQNDGYDVTLSTNEGIGKLICLCAKYGCIGDNDNDFFGKPALFSYPDEVLSAAAETSIRTSCLELMTSVAREGNYCFGCTVENGRIKVFTYPYTDWGHTFDVSAGTVSDVVYTTSCDSERNVFGYSLGSDSEGYTYVISSLSDDVSGTQRRMLNLGRYSSAPVSVIREKRALLTSSESVEAKILLPYPEMLSLGEIIEIKNPKWNFSKKLAVTSVREIWEHDYSCRVTFGIPGETVHRKLLRIYK